MASGGPKWPPEPFRTPCRTLRSHFWLFEKTDFQDFFWKILVIDFFARHNGSLVFVFGPTDPHGVPGRYPTIHFLESWASGEYALGLVCHRRGKNWGLRHFSGGPLPVFDGNPSISSLKEPFPGFTLFATRSAPNQILSGKIRPKLFCITKYVLKTIRAQKSRSITDLWAGLVVGSFEISIYI